jgi:drug/metabolite transporter (DMT)-like permease
MQIVLISYYIAKAKWLILCFVGMVVTGLASLAFINIPMYSVLRRLTTCITLVGERIVLGRTIPSDEQTSVYLMVGGAVFAGIGDLEFSWLGYILIMVNCVFTAGYLIFIKQSQSLGLSDFALMYYSNIVGIPIYIAMVLLTEIEGVLRFDGMLDAGFIVRSPRCRRFFRLRKFRSDFLTRCFPLSSVSSCHQCMHSC